MGTLHAWESFGDGEPPDIQAVAKGLGGGRVIKKNTKTLYSFFSKFIDMPPLVPF